MRSANPALNDDTFWDVKKAKDNPMTIDGTVNKSFLLIILVFISSYWSWIEAFPPGITVDPETASLPNWYIPVIIVSFVMGLYIIKNPHHSPYLAPIYAILEGVTLGALSAYFEIHYPGIAIQAISCTFATFLAMLLLYKLKWIPVTDNYRYGVATATMGIAIIYIISLGMQVVGLPVPYIHGSGYLSIGVSVFVIGIAALNLTLDFDYIEFGAKRGAEKHMEWYSAFGLLVTLLWLYVEFLRLLAKARSRD